MAQDGSEGQQIVSYQILRFFRKATHRRKNKDHRLSIWYLSVDMQNHILNGTVLLDQCQSSPRTQTGYLVTVVTAQQNTKVNKLEENCTKKGKFEDICIISVKWYYKL